MLRAFLRSAAPVVAVVALTTGSALAHQDSVATSSPGATTRKVPPRSMVPLHVTSSTRSTVFRVDPTMIAQCVPVAGRDTAAILCHLVTAASPEMDQDWTTRMATLILGRSEGDVAPKAEFRPDVGIRFVSEDGAVDVLLSLKARRLMVAASGATTATGSFDTAYHDFLKMLAEAMPGDREIAELVELPTACLIVHILDPDDSDPAEGEFVLYDTPPEPVTQVRPEYPQFAKDAGIEGTVVMHVLVRPDGRVATIKVVKSTDGRFNEAAFNAVKQWIFTPATVKDRPIAVWVEVPMSIHR